MWYPQRQVDYALMEQAAAQRRWRQLHEKMPFHDGTFKSWAEKPSLSHPYHFDDGHRIWVASTDVNPDDDFLRQGSGAELPPEPQGD